MLMIRYGQVVTTAAHTAYASYETLSKIFGASRSQMYRLIQERFERERQKQLPFLQRLRL